MKKHFFLPQVLLCFTVSGCLDSPADHSSNAADTENAVHKRDKLEVASIPLITGEARVEMSPGGKISMDSAMQKVVGLAKQDLATKLSMGVEEIETLKAENVTWRDSSLGCPEPGHQYMQVLTNGSRITLRAKKRTYHYHSGESRPPFLCAKPSANEPMPYAPGET